MLNLKSSVPLSAAITMRATSFLNQKPHTDTANMRATGSCPYLCMCIFLRSLDTPLLAIAVIALLINGSPTGGASCPVARQTVLK